MGSVALSLPTLSGKLTTRIGPWLPWYAPDQVNLLFVVLWLYVCPERLANALVEGHPASALRTDGSLRSDCLELAHGQPPPSLVSSLLVLTQNNQLQYDGLVSALQLLPMTNHLL